jgi:hypothetical protein
MRQNPLIGMERCKACTRQQVLAFLVYLFREKSQQQ